MKDECSMLKLQLKERDELISQLQEELEKVQHLQKAFASRVDKSTQTELPGCDGLNLRRLETVQGGREGTAYGSAPVSSRRQLCYISKSNCEPKSQHKGQKSNAYSHRGPF
nr:coiled-coil serine rich protein 1 [Rousettus aegyptiacus]